MYIGNVEIEGKVALAPMAGVADRAMRELAIEYGAAFVVGEMTSAKGIHMQDPKSFQLLQVGSKEHPCSVQIFGNEPETMAEAAVKAIDFTPDFLDINMGCPAPKVASSGGGSALLKNPALAGDIMKAVVKASSLPVTVKLRTGWDDKNINVIEMARRAEDAGIAAIILHGRTRAQMYAPPVNWDWIRQVKECVRIPVIGNGDVTDGESAATMLEQTGCDMVMVGRGALGAPWIFASIQAYLDRGEILPDPPLATRMEIMLRHVRLLCQYKGDYIGMREARKHAAWYIKGLRGAAALRQEAGKLENIVQLEALAERVLQLDEET